MIAYESAALSRQVVAFRPFARTLIVCLLGALAAAQEAPVAGDDPVVLRVGESEVRSSEYARWLVQNLGAQMARTFADDWIVGQEARRVGVVVDSEQVRERLDAEIQERVTHAFLGVREDWLAELARTGRSEVGLRRQRFAELEPYLEAEALCARDRVVPREKIRREWELVHGRNGRAYDVLLMKFQVEFLTPASGTPREEAERRRQGAIDEQLARASDARDLVIAGAAFEDVAADESDDPVTRANRGRLPAGFHHVGWPDSFMNALEALEPGALSEPLYARGGWWLVKVLDVVTTPLEQVSEQIEHELLLRGPGQDEVGQLRAALAQDMTVEVPPSLFDFEDAPAELNEPVVGLIVNGQPVPRVEYLRWLMDVRGESTVRHFAEHFIVSKHARERGFDVGEDEVRERSLDYIERMIVLSHRGDREAWRAHLAATGRDEGAFLRDLMVRMRMQLLTERLMMSEREITTDDVRRRWEEVYGHGGERLTVRLLLVNIEVPMVENDVTREELRSLSEQARGRAESEARQLAVRIAGGEDFATLARKYSAERTSGEQGGLLPDRFRAEHWPKEVAAAVESLVPGQTSEVLDLGTAWGLFQLVGRETVEFAAVQDELRQELEGDRPSFANLSMYRNKLLLESPPEVLPGMHAR